MRDSPITIIKRDSPKYDPLLIENVTFDYVGVRRYSIPSALMTGKLEYCRSLAFYLLFIHTDFTINDIAEAFELPYNRVNTLINSFLIDIKNNRRKHTKDLKNILNIIKNKHEQ